MERPGDVGGPVVIALVRAILVGALLLLVCPAQAATTYEYSGAVGLGELTAGVGPGAARFAISPSFNFAVRGEEWFFRAQDTVSILGATGGGQLGVNNTTSIGGGHYWKSVNFSVGASISTYAMVVCGATLCGRLTGVAPGGDIRLDVFGPYLSGSLGLAFTGHAMWIAGSADAVWRGLSGTVVVGPIFRFSSH